MPHIDTEGIPLRGIRYSETSQILTLLTRGHGAVRAIAKGAHRKKGGGVDLLRIYRVVLITKPSGALATLCEWECTDPLTLIRLELDRLLAAWYKTEVAEFLSPEGTMVGEIYEILRESLRELDDGAPVATNTLLFAGRMLRLSGYQPSLEKCGDCGKGVPLRGTVRYLGGTLLCDPCRGERAQSYPGAALALVRSLLASGTGDARSVRYPPHLLVGAQAFLDDRFREICERDLRTLRYWKRWGGVGDRLQKAEVP